MIVKILVTGANGFLGSAIINELIDADLSVKSTDINEYAIIDKVSYHQADILRPSTLTSAFDDIDAVIHAAGLAHKFDKSKLYSNRFHEVNAEGTKNVIETAAKKGIKRFVLISSVSVYGGYSYNNDENSICNPETPYAESKLNAEHLAIQTARESGINLTILRLATLYGEGDPGNIARLIRVLDKDRFVWIGKGKNLKSLLHRNDAARACVEVVKKPLSGINVYNVSAPPHSMKEIVDTIAFALKKYPPSWNIPASFTLNFAKAMNFISLNHGRLSNLYDTLQKWIAEDYYNAEKFYNTFDFKTKISLIEGIQEEVSWYKKSTFKER